MQLTTRQYGQNYIAWHVVETKSSLPGAENELSLYASEGAWTGNSNAIRRYSLRLDGFVSIRGGWKGGEVVTRSLKFSGSKLELNFATSAVGSILVEIQDASGKPIRGYSLADCDDVFGDSTSRTVQWKKQGTDVRSIAGQTVKLRFVLKDADLYSLKFSDPK